MGIVSPLREGLRVLIYSYRIIIYINYIVLLLTYPLFY